MSERHDIVLREAPGQTPNPPGLIPEVRDLIKEILPETAKDLANSGVGWIKGKSQQEIAKAMEIKASAMEKLGGLEIERQRLIKEREELLLKAQTEQKRDEQIHEQKMFELKTQRFKEVVEALKVTNEKGIKLNARTIRTIESKLIELVDPSQT